MMDLVSMTSSGLLSVCIRNFFHTESGETFLSPMQYLKSLSIATNLSCAFVRDFLAK